MENDNTLKIKNEKTRSLLLFTNVTEKHFGNYTCFASNRLGASNASMLLFSEYTQTIVKLLASTFSQLYKYTKVQCQECINPLGENNTHERYCVLSALPVLTKDCVHTKMHASISLPDIFCITKTTKKRCLFLSPGALKPSFFLSPWHFFYPFISPDPSIRWAVMLSVVYRLPIFAPFCPALPQSHDFSPSILLSLIPFLALPPPVSDFARSLLRSCHTTAHYHRK